MGKLDLTKPEYFYNRELSWLKFNLRVLKEAMGKETPLLERLKFIAISASNLDEFFMVRVAGLWSNFDSGVEKRDASGMSVHEQLVAISQAAHEQVRTQTKSLIALMAEMDAVKLHFRRVKDLSELGKDWLEEYYREVVFPVLTPMAVDASRPFPFLANKTLNLAVELIKADGEHSMGLIQVPSVLDRIVEVEPEGKRTFVFLEDIIASHCHDLFKGCHILDMVSFRVTRDSDLDLEEDDSVDLMKEVEESLRKRKRGAAVRLEIFKTNNNRIKKFLEENLDVTEMEVYEINGPLDPTCFFKFIGMKGMWPWLYEPFVPQRPLELPDDSDLFAAIRENDILLHHPYESFDPVVKLVSDAADDPQVLAIKQTLYRVSGNSPIVAALARAAENGKQVTVLVELKARFDEENNILWARRLEKAGCHVIYGLLGLKTHSKITLVVRREEEGIRRYVHLGTGNYNDSTAKLYTDCGLLTCDPLIGEDATAVFNMLSGYSEPLGWNKLSLAPLWLRGRFLRLIQRETRNAREGIPARIVAKMNSLCDREIIASLYEASNAGVKIQLIVRGICCLRAGIPGLSENITVCSIVGNFLEHSRIFYFENDGEPQIFMGSADWMPRNLDRRVEILFPVEDEKLKARICHILEVQLADNVKAQYLRPDGTYAKRNRRGKEPVCAQDTFCAEAVQAAKEAGKKQDPAAMRVFIPLEQ